MINEIAAKVDKKVPLGRKSNPYGKRAILKMIVKSMAEKQRSKAGVTKEGTACGKGEYFCRDEQKCKPIPKGHHVMKDGNLMKGETHKETTDLKNEILKKAQDRHAAAKKKKFKDFMSSAMSAKDRRKKGVRATKGGKWGYYKGGKFKSD
jgi:hypothetical protein|tara:strand:- start:367 stop:816 length:450 start_codon:yes stop_codon:yes gene_type:complete